MVICMYILITFLYVHFMYTHSYVCICKLQCISLSAEIADKTILEHANTSPNQAECAL